MSDETESVIDIHAHILPGIDDGSRNMMETLKLLEQAYIQGICTIIATPHYHYTKYRIDSHQVLSLTEKVQKAAEQIAGDLKIYSGEEIFYFDGIVDMLRQGELLTLAGSRYVLIEFSLGSSYAKIYQAVRKLSEEGYIPILAHVERYECLRKDGRIEELIHSGACIQINYKSFVGLQNIETRMWCRRMARDEMVHFLGTDMHRMDFRPPDIKKTVKWLDKQCGLSMRQKLTRENPSYILANKYI